MLELAMARASQAMLFTMWWIDVQDAQAQCEIQGKPLFKGSESMLSRRGRQASPEANFAKALYRQPCGARGLHSAWSL